MYNNLVYDGQVTGSHGHESGKAVCQSLTSTRSYARMPCSSNVTLWSKSKYTMNRNGRLAKRIRKPVEGVAW